MGSIRINISAPDIVNVCFDRVTETEKTGRMYSCYQKEAILFSNELQLIKEMEALMDRLNYPQNAMDVRRYGAESRAGEKKRPEKLADQEAIMKERGAQGTFVIHVQYRQNATWQGKLIHVESGETLEFRSVLELLKIFDGEL